MAAYRRRSDGMLEITRPKPSRNVRGAVSTFAAALSLVLLPAFALLVFVSIGVPLFPVVAAVLLGTLAAAVMREHAQPPPREHGAPIPLMHPEARSSPADVGARTP